MMTIRAVLRALLLAATSLAQNSIATVVERVVDSFGVGSGQSNRPRTLLLALKLLW